MLLLFDYDGVIVDSFDSLLEVCVEAQTALGEGRTPSPDDFRTIKNLSFDELGRIIGISEGACAAYCAKAFEIQRTRGCASTFPGVAEVIQELSVQHTIAVVTNSQSHVVNSALDEFGLGAAVTSVMGGESGETKADRIVNLKARHSASGETTYMIGDTVGDIHAGKKAGVQTVAVTWGFQARELLVREEPNYLADHPEELLTITRRAGREHQSGLAVRQNTSAK